MSWVYGRLDFASVNDICRRKLMDLSDGWAVDKRGHGLREEVSVPILNSLIIAFTIRTT